jgi:hypothetical protein
MPVLATPIQLRAGGLVIGLDPFFNSQIEQLAALVLHHAVLAVYEWRRIGLDGNLRCNTRITSTPNDQQISKRD